MFRRLFGNKSGRSDAGSASELDAALTNGPGAATRPRSSGAFAGAQQVPSHTLIVVLPANHSVSFERIAARTRRSVEQDLEVIVACAGQPAHATVTAIHAHLRAAQFLLAPAQMAACDLRVLAILRATGDIVTLVDGIPEGSITADHAGRGGRPSDAAGTPLSIIVPVHNEGTLLDESLAAIVASDLARDSYELIVVDDASADRSLPAAARYADTIVRLKAEARGAAYARNRGADQARGGVLAFVDADVCVRPDTFSKLLGTLTGNSHVGAVGASSDGTSGDGGVPTQYWNLLHQLGAKKHGGAGIKFEAACGAVRKNAFIAAGMYNEWLFRGASVEDLDLGLRLHRGGYEVLFRGDVAVSHLRAHSISEVLTSVWRRSTVLTRTLSYSVTRPLARADLVHTLNTAKGFAAIGVATLLVFALFNPRPVTVTLSAAAFLLLLAVNLDAYRFFAHRRGLTFAIAAAPLHVAAQVVAAAGRCHGWVLRNVVGDPSPDATTQAFAEVGAEIWPPVPRKL